jgi:TctA family transporter
MFEILGLLGQGFVVVFEPQNLLLIIGGCTLGLFIGAMPGLGSVNGVAILLPLTFLVPPTGAIIFLAAIYYGAMYGGAISSIMLGIPRGVVYFFRTPTGARRVGVWSTRRIRLDDAGICDLCRPRR